MSYRDRNRKTITLPSKATIVIAKLTTYTEPFIVSRKGDDELTSGVRLAKFALTNPDNSELTYQDKTDGKIERLRIVDKVKAAEGEITVTELDQEDADAIVRAVVEFSGLGNASREARKTFPEGQAQSCESPSPGNGLPHTPDGAAEAAD